MVMNKREDTTSIVGMLARALLDRRQNITTDDNQDEDSVQWD